MQNIGIIAKQGYKYLAIFGGLWLLSLVFGALECLFFAIFLATLFFFRNPERAAGSDDEYAILSPIDGKIKSIDKISYLGSDCTQIVIQRSLLGVGVLRAPCDMKVVEFKQRHGLFLCNAIKAANFLNERALFVCEYKKIKFAMRFIGGVLSRNLYVDNASDIKSGRRFGFMTDGRVVLILPQGARIGATVGDHLKAASSVIGFFNHEG